MLSESWQGSGSTGGAPPAVPVLLGTAPARTVEAEASLALGGGGFVALCVFVT